MEIPCSFRCRAPEPRRGVRHRLEVCAAGNGGRWNPAASAGVGGAHDGRRRDLCRVGGLRAGDAAGVGIRWKHDRGARHDVWLPRRVGGICAGVSRPVARGGSHGGRGHGRVGVPGDPGGARLAPGFERRGGCDRGVRDPGDPGRDAAAGAGEVQVACAAHQFGQQPQEPRPDFANATVGREIDGLSRFARRTGPRRGTQSEVARRSAHGRAVHICRGREVEEKTRWESWPTPPRWTVPGWC